ncbi:hypothetical protein [Costertonia aggregata]|uniref:Uncharacterized protein n=1 Tax=Costertonia aggregata TaxID=343403 RepID=A0A7H9ASU1_9FLAO|nr:hypothetical protein [Costertonia aggregata]QLG46524.1 hypothetical protein HYG79_14600 [Costertonia aggregata]
MENTKNNSKPSTTSKSEGNLQNGKFQKSKKSARIVRIVTITIAVVVVLTIILFSTMDAWETYRLWP